MANEQDQDCLYGFTPELGRGSLLADLISRPGGVVAALAVVGAAIARRFCLVGVAGRASGNLGKGGIGKSRGIDPRTETANLSRVLVAVNEGPAAVGWLEILLVFVAIETWRQL